MKDAQDLAGQRLFIKPLDPNHYFNIGYLLGLLDNLQHYLTPEQGDMVKKIGEQYYGHTSYITNIGELGGEE